ncbi:RDD family protein [Streptococcus caprae]|uniref:RDD family protein n=1 Tax=Streptococcus caprae TaxID=1640501 RepID=A0ABV8CWZ7_9STRE
MIHLSLQDWPKQCFGGFWIRFFAYLIDSLLIGAITKIILNLTIHHFITPTAASGHWWYELIKLALFVAYFVATMLYFKGQTVGKYLLNLKVVSVKTGDLDFQTLLIREVAGRIVLYYFPILAVTLVFTNLRQHLMDLLCDTAVVNLKQVDFVNRVHETSLIIPDGLQEDPIG